MSPPTRMSWGSDGLTANPVTRPPTPGSPNDVHPVVDSVAGVATCGVVVAVGVAAVVAIGVVLVGVVAVAAVAAGVVDVAFTGVANRGATIGALAAGFAAEAFGRSRGPSAFDGGRCLSACPRDRFALSHRPLLMSRALLPHALLSSSGPNVMSELRLDWGRRAGLGGESLADQGQCPEDDEAEEEGEVPFCGHLTRVGPTRRPIAGVR